METAVARPIKYKRRRVSAVRDFPAGCGPGAAPLPAAKSEVNRSPEVVRMSPIKLEEFEWRSFLDERRVPSPTPAEEENSLAAFVPNQTEPVSMLVVKSDPKPVSLMEPPKLVPAGLNEDVPKTLRSPPDCNSAAAAGAESLSGVLVKLERAEILDLPEFPKLSSDQSELLKEDFGKFEIVKESIDQTELQKEASDLLELSKEGSDQPELPKKSSAQPDLRKLAADQLADKMQLLQESAQMEILNRWELLMGSLDQSEQLVAVKNVDLSINRCYSKRYPPPRRRKVSAIRDYPIGCGSASQLNRKGSMEVDASAPVKWKSLVAAKACAVNQHPAVETSREVKHTGRDLKKVGPKQTSVVLHVNDGEGRVKYVSDSLKNKSFERENFAAKQLVENSHAEARTDAVKLIRDINQDIPSGARWKSSGNMVEECHNMKILVRSDSEKKFKKHDAALLTKETCEGMPSPDSGSLSEKKPSIKMGTGSVAKPDMKRLVKPTANAVGLKRKYTEQFRNTGRIANGEMKVGCQTFKRERTLQCSTFTEASVSGRMNEQALTLYEKPQESTITSLVPLKRNHNGSLNKVLSDRAKVKRVLRYFQYLCRKYLQEQESRPNERLKRVDLRASGTLKEKGELVNKGDKAILGHVPGVEVGDEFQYRVELSIVGLHRPFQAGIDSTKMKGKEVATSIVASGGYQDEIDSSDVLIYSGSGGNAASGGKHAGKEAEDQKLQRGNLALKNSMDAETSVRVIYGFKDQKGSERDAKAKTVSTFTYDGLYRVEKYWTEKGPHGFSVFKFQLRREPGQPELGLKEVRRSKNRKVREGLCMKDISEGKESRPICAVNTVNDERPMPFKYITKNIYPPCYVRMPPSGCACISKCSDSSDCACAVKNGGETPFNNNGDIVNARALVYECGPSCKCPSSCSNRVSQHGIQTPLEIFKTKSRGWGVRSLHSIPSGRFICEYVGQVLKDSDAEARTSNDQYLFDIGHNYEDKKLWEGLPFIPSVQSNSISEATEDGGFTIDAAEYGNIGRFINHSCSPNIFSQAVLYDHNDKRIPHIMFFALDNIPPLQELTYHYGYTPDTVIDSEGNIKRKECKCGFPDCSGRLY